VNLWQNPGFQPPRTPYVTDILGISAYYHDSAAALIRDGEIIAAAQEERFSRRKHDHRFPVDAVAYCLAEGGITAEAIDYVCFYDKPLLKFDRLLETYVSYAPRGFRSFLSAMPQWLGQKLHLPREIRRNLQGRNLRGRDRPYQGPLVFVEHHESHAASAFFPSPFEEAAIITADGVGEWETTTWGVGKGNRIEIKEGIRFPHSLGLLYSAFTYFAGFKVNSGEYKLMGLAPYGRPIYADLIREKLIQIRPDGSYRLNLDYFTYPHGLRMTGDELGRLFGGPPRRSEDQITQREMDLAASIQAVTEEVMLATARSVHQKTKMKNLCLAGGVALNCVANGRLLREGPFEKIWIQPAAGDAGGALGGALFVWHQLLGKPRPVDGKGDAQKGSLLGPRFSGETIESFLTDSKASFRRPATEADLLDQVADLLSGGQIVGWFQGRMEFGPRALGSRSILGDARSPTLQATMNLKIKFRESFRPFAPSILRERASEYFDLRADEESPYMLLVAPVKKEHRTKLTVEQRELLADSDLRKRVNVPRSTIPAVTHVDYSARIQTVDEERHGRYYRLLKRFAEKTGCPVIVNTSFNIRGEPIVCRPEEAFNCFLNTDLDALVLEDFLLVKSDQPSGLLRVGGGKYLSRFELD
jgi:carbamoyltransferase